jgi:large subunit ribosomal protein L35
MRPGLPGRQETALADEASAAKHDAAHTGRRANVHVRRDGGDGDMPKMKTHSGTAQRFKLTGTGKVMRRRAGRKHLFEHKSSRVTRRLEGEVQVAPSDVRAIKKLLGK